MQSRGMPLSFVIARYFAYAFVAVAATWLVAFVALSAAINMGFVHEASWGPANVREVAGNLAREGVRGPQDVPTAYQYLVTDAAGEALMTDLEGARLDRASEMARAALGATPGAVEVEGGGAGLTYAAFPLADGGACALVSEYLPQWVSRDLVELLPNPQNLMLAAGVVGSAVALALVARRASHVLARKMAPLVAVAERVGREELGFKVKRTNVREVNDVLVAMDAMRASLADSLEARWEAERTQREQVAALAHDLKTPLTVLRANADFIGEELADGRALGEKDREELTGAARDIAAGTERLDGYVRLLIEVSRGTAGAARDFVRPAELCSQIVAEAGPVARARSVELAVSVDSAVAAAPAARLDRAALARAAANLVSNAAEHARSRVTLSCGIAKEDLVIEVADDGTGFSPAALEHGRERFFTDDASRGVHDGEPHYGIGLYTADAVARAHGGSLTLANRTDDDGPVLGAVATISVPLDC
ncbi:ATP-binding protein [Olsenella profusa]|uniref:histidine kinase n=1 Tax=Olsenella profusa TaxID=138595 RepID=A0ABS2F002_9ACTN|nr:HAMP domain-containing histidine kinase [Olsenella profusa]